MKVKKLCDPIIYTKGCWRGQTPACPTADTSTVQVHVVLCSPRGASPATGDGDGCLNPVSLEALGDSLLQSNSLPACMCALVRNVHEVRVPRAARLSPFPSPAPGEKAFCPTWDEEQGSCGREDDPAGRMVHLGAAVD